MFAAFRVALVLLGLLAACPLSAAGIPKSTAAITSEIKTLLGANGSGDIAAQLAPAIAQAVVSSVDKATQNPSARVDEIVSNIVVGYVRQQDVQQALVNLLVPVYARYLTKEDVEQLIMFYRSPIGRKLASVTPAISIESAKVGQAWAVSLIPGIRQKVAEALKDQK